MNNDYIKNEVGENGNLFVYGISTRRWRWNLPFRGVVSVEMVAMKNLSYGGEGARGVADCPDFCGRRNMKVFVSFSFHNQGWIACRGWKSKAISRSRKCLIFHIYFETKRITYTSIFNILDINMAWLPTLLHVHLKQVNDRGQAPRTSILYVIPRCMILIYRPTSTYSHEPH